MSDAHAPASDLAHDDHHDDDPWSHVPPPSFWPFGVGVGLILMFTTTSYALWQVSNNADGGLWLSIGCTVVMLFMLMGWAHQIIKEKKISHDLNQGQEDLKLFTKLFLISELAAFGAIFGYFYIMRLSLDDFSTPEGMHLGGPLVAFATFLLLSSSVTCEFAHHAIMHGDKGKARMLLLTTLILGFIFLGFQGFEYGELVEHGFGLTTSAYSSVFYISTGFHGVHVLTGLVMLFLVWIRLEMGHYTKERHASFISASWYWHFVDIVWILLFITVYVV